MTGYDELYPVDRIPSHVSAAPQDAARPSRLLSWPDWNLGLRAQPGEPQQRDSYKRQQPSERARDARVCREKSHIHLSEKRGSDWSKRPIGRLKTALYGRAR